MNDDKHDYGYFGKGIDGYVHYNQSFNKNFGKTAKNFKKTNAGCAWLYPIFCVNSKK